jgi:hypothetical protein
MAEGEVMSVPRSDQWGGHQLVMRCPGLGADLARWAAHGLARGDRVLYAADGQHPDGTSLAATLDAHGVDAARAVDDGRMIVVAPAQFYDLASYERLVEDGMRDGHGGVRSFGGPETAAGVLDPSGFADFERLLDRLWTTQGATALCCYQHSDVDALRSAIRRHPSGWGQHPLRVHHDDGDRWAVNGEVDASNDELFATLLSAAADRVAANGTTTCGRGPRLILDCTGLTYGAVAAWRAAAAGTEAFRAGGGRVALIELRPLMVQVLQMTGYAAAFDVSGAAGAGRR